VTIWRGNDTLTYIVPHRQDDSSHSCDSTRGVSGKKVLPFTLLVKATTQMSQTAAYFLNLEEATQKSNSYLLVRSNRSNFHFPAAGDRCLKRMMDTVPSRRMELNGIALSVAQSVALATSHVVVHVAMHVRRQGHCVC
jgi:hypothetical protein